MFISLFLSAFIAATILPAQSEAVLSYFIATTPDAVIALVVVASLGNILGSVVNWALGKTAMRFQHAKWFPASTSQLERAEKFYAKCGRYSLLLSWVPFIGDPITVVAGMLKEPLFRFLIFVSIAKTGRYIILAITVQSLTPAA